MSYHNRKFEVHTLYKSYTDESLNQLRAVFMHEIQIAEDEESKEFSRGRVRLIDAELKERNASVA